jgi:hypothetical protein
MTAHVCSCPAELKSAPLFTPTPKAAKRVLEFFTAQINNDHTRARRRVPRPVARPNPAAFSSRRR